jgi:hypothetical protein
MPDVRKSGQWPVVSGQLKAAELGSARRLLRLESESIFAAKAKLEN